MRVASHGVLDSLEGMAQRILNESAGRFAIAGHSMGGRVALEVFRTAPERVSGIALMDTGVGALPAGDEGLREAEGRAALLAKARAEGMRAMAREWVQGMVHPGRLRDARLIEPILDMFEAKSPDIYAAQIRALLNRPDASEVLGTIRCPALVLCGHEDAWAPVQRHRDMAAAIGRCAFADIPNCGHMSTMERPQAVNEAMLSWLRTVGAAEKARSPRGGAGPRLGGACS